jgi:S-DNA-T family DNA segregation ATPase FtsK/SpoIIIE
LGPVVVVGGWVEQRLRARRHRARAASDTAAEHRNHHEVLGRWWTTEVHRLRAAHPGPRRLADRATHGEALWERRPGHPDAGVARLGTVAARPTGVEVTELPVTVALVPGAIVGIVGPADARRGLARALVAGHAVLHGPADATIEVVAPGGDADLAWRWCRWLPHQRAAASATVAGTPSIDGTVDTSCRPTARLDLLVVDADPAADSPPTTPAPRPDGGAVLVLAPTTGDLPAGCTTVVITDGRLARGSTTLAGASRTPGTVEAAGFHPVDSTPAERKADQPAAWVSTGTPFAADRAAVFVPDALDATRAEVVARQLAGWQDPEDRRLDARVPRLDALLGLDPASGSGATTAQLVGRWSRATTDALAAPLGSGPDGPVIVDLVADGPHALIAGTTGAGKSELLRTLITGWAAAVGPDRLTFLLVDFKGGAAFDGCVGLPHTAGVVTDLDGGLAERVLLALDAEVARRERVLRARGATRLEELDGRAGASPLGRLVVVVDELATLVVEVPAAVDRLVDIGRRGRSLGVHLVLATQRPTGVITDQLRANVTLRIALRVADRADAVDVVGVAAPAAFRADEPGRFVARLGTGSTVVGQAAPASARVTGADRRRAPGRGLVHVQPAFEARDEVREGVRVDDPRDGPTPVAPTVLDAVTEAAVEAARRLDLHPPAAPWHPPLPDELDRHDHDQFHDQFHDHDQVHDHDDGLGNHPGAGARRPHEPVVVLGLADDPARQWQGPLRWRPGGGHLVVHGVSGSGTTTTLVTAALDLAGRFAPDRLHLYAADAGRELAVLEGLPHTGTVVRVDDRARLARLVHRLDDERRRRLQATVEDLADLPRVLLLVDGLAAATAALADHDHRSLEALQRVWAGGARLGIHLAVVAHQVTDITPIRAAHVGRRVVLRLADRYDLAALGLPVDQAPTRAGRAGRGVDDLGRVVQVAGPGATTTGTAALVARWASRQARPAPTAGGPQPLTGVPARVAAGVLPSASCRATEGWMLPLGLDEDRRVAALVLHPGEHALVTGPPRSGRSTALRTLAAGLRRAGVTVVALCPRSSPVDQIAHVVVRRAGDLAALPELGDADRSDVADPPRLAIVIDDAELVDDDGELTLLLDRVDPSRRVLAGAGAERLGTRFGTWTTALTRGGRGLALRPDLDDHVADLFGRRVPTGPLPPPDTDGDTALDDGAGRGYLVQAGRVTLVQVAR